MYFNTNVPGFLMQAGVRDLNGNKIMSHCWFSSAEHGVFTALSLVYKASVLVMNDVFMLLLSKYGQRR